MGENALSSHAMVEDPESTGTDVAGSAVSGSSANSATNSRRALILQMAKARMKNNKESPVTNSAPVMAEDEADETVFTEANGTVATHEFDLTGDLD